MKILSFDIGKKGAWCYKNSKISDIYESEELDFITLQAYLKTIQRLLYFYKPDIVLAARPTRYARVIAYHSKLLSIIELVCEMHKIQYYEVIDSQCKKTVFGKGNIKKPEIMARYNENSEHIADAKMFCDFAFLNFSK